MFGQKIASAYKEVFSTPNGELVMADLANYCRLLKAHPINDADAQRCEGMRSVFLYILDRLSKKQYKEMVDNQLQYDEQATYDRILTEQQYH